MKRFLPVFRQAAARLDPVLKRHGLESRAGLWLDSAVLKVTKPGWGAASAPAAAAHGEIFFSVWIEEKGLKQKRVFYNIHALRLRKLEAYALQSREFAAAFRAQFAPVSRAWPNVAVNYGPQTLMQGWIEWDETRLADDLVALTERFLPLGAVVDGLLEARKKVRARAA